MSNNRGEVIDYNLLKRVLFFAQPYKRALYFAIFFSVILSFITPIRPLLINYAVDNYIIVPNLDKLRFICIILLSLLLLDALFNFLYIYFANWIGQHVIKDLRSRVYQKIISFRMKYFDNTPIGTLVTRTISDIETVSDIFSQGLFVIIGELLKLIVIISMMFYADWRLALISMISVPVLLIATEWFKRNIKQSFQDVRTQVSNINTFVQERIVGMQLVQIFNREEAEYAKFKDINKDHLDAHLRSVLYYSLFFPIVEILSAVSIGCVIWLGGEAIVSGKDVTLGELIAFILYIHMMFRPIRQLADRFNVLQMGIVGSERVFNILDKNEEIKDEGVIEKDVIDGNLEYRNVYFGYKKNQLVLQDICFKIQNGKSLGIAGETGSGKTSIVNTLGRFYEINKGDVLVDNISINNYRLKNLRKHISIVNQEVHLFSDSIYNNIRMYDDNISDEEIVIAAKEIGIHDFIMKFPNGYHYIVGERGITLSAGQRQLISFLRVYFRNPKILILDEATSSIDSETESVLQSCLNKISRGRTTIIIAHRLSTIVNCDHILCLKDGSIIEEGNHMSLMNIDGYYRDMYNKQLEM